MAPSGLLSLPFELLDRVYSYLNWDPSDSLCPSRPDIINISLACRRLRESIIPTLFRHVILKLRWYDDSLLEPCLFRLRRHRPDLARHVRSVYIATEFHRTRDPPPVVTPFSIPEDLSDWIQPAAARDITEDLSNHLHRQRVKIIAREVFQDARLSGSLPEVSALSAFIKERLRKFQHHILDEEGSESTRAPPEFASLLDRFEAAAKTAFEDRAAPRSWSNGTTFAAQATLSRNERGQIDVVTLHFDALVVAILCLPANVTSLTFKAHSSASTDIPGNAFALNVAAAACKIFGDRLQRLTMISSPSGPFRAGSLGPERLTRENSVFNTDVVGELKKLTTLVISDAHESVNLRQRNLMSEYEIKWSQLADTVEHLELWNCRHEKTDILRFIRQFERLQSLALQNVALYELPVRGAARTSVTETIWLKWMIELRREYPQLAMQLSRLTCGRSSREEHLPRSAVHWLVNEAAPTGCTIGYEREERLTEDFESFLGLWSAEDSERGFEAREARKDGRLVDEAMTNRWKTYAHLRK